MFLKLKPRLGFAWTDNWLILFLKWSPKPGASDICQLVYFFPTTMWNVNESMQAEETFERGIFSLNIQPTQWIALWHWKIGKFDWLNLFHSFCWSSHTTIRTQRSKMNHSKLREGALWILQRNRILKNTILMAYLSLRPLLHPSPLGYLGRAFGGDD